MKPAIVKTYPLTSSRKLIIAQGDITQEASDAIVNAANSHLSHGAGVAAAILRAGGQTIQEESDAWVRQHGPVTNETPAYTTGGKLLARFVIHAVGPIWGEGAEDRKLTAAIQGSLARADELGLQSIAFPAISTGIFGFPKARAALIFFDSIHAYFKQNEQSSLQVVKIILMDQESLDIFVKAGEKSAFE